MYVSNKIISNFILFTDLNGMESDPKDSWMPETKMSRDSIMCAELEADVLRFVE